MKDRSVLLCRHCGNNAPQKLLFNCSGKEAIYTEEGGTFELEDYYYLTQCETCSNVSLYTSYEFADNPENWWEGSLLYPASKDLPALIPEKVRKAYLEASRISKIAPNAFAGQIRRALEYLCRDKQAKGSTLNEMVSDLSHQGIIPPVLARMTEGIRILGNVGVHATDVEIDATDVATMDDFFKAIIEYVYIAPNKVAKLKDRLSTKKK